MNLYLEGEIDEELFKKLVDFYNENGDEVDHRIYLNSNGGDMGVAMAMIDLINIYTGTTTLVATNTIHSAAFEVFFRTNCKKIVLQYTTGMVHKTYVFIKTNESRTPIDNYARHLLEIGLVECEKDSNESLAKLSLTKEETESYNKGEEVYFSTTRLIELLKTYDK